MLHITSTSERNLIKHVSIKDISGNVLRSFKVENQLSTNIDMKDFNTGLYFVVVDNITYKVFKK